MQAAVELNAEPAKTRDLFGCEKIAEGVVVSFFATVFEHERAARERMNGVAGERAQHQAFGFAAGISAAFRVRERHATPV